MGKSISELSVSLFGDIGNFATSFSKNAVGEVESFSSKILSVGGGLAALGGASAIATAALNAVTEGVRNAVEGIEGRFEAIDAVAKFSDSIGVSTQALTGLQYAASLSGVSSEQLGTSLQFMLKNLGEAATTGGPAAEALQRLGLSAQGIASESPDQAFKDIATALSQIQNPAERAADAVGIFGRSGQELLPLLMSGADGIAAAQKEADKLGFSFSRVDARQIEMANDAMTRLKSVFTGVWNQLAVQLAPIIEEVATDFVAWANQGSGLKDQIGGAIKNVVFLLAGVGDTVMGVADWAFNNLTKKSNSALATVAEDLAKLASWGAKLEAHTTGTHVFSGISDGLNGLSSTFRNANKAGDEFFQGWEDHSFGDAATDFFNGVDNRAAKMAHDLNHQDIHPLGNAFPGNTKEVDKLLSDLQSKISQFGMTAGQIDLAKLAAAGATPQQLGAAKMMQGMLDALNTGKTVKDKLNELHQQTAEVFGGDRQKQMDEFLKIPGIDPTHLAQLMQAFDQLSAMKDKKKALDDLFSAGKQVTEANQTPAEKMAASLAKLKEELNAGAITWTTYERAVAKAKASMEADSISHQAAGIVKSGSAEAQLAAYTATRDLAQSAPGKASPDQMAGGKPFAPNVPKPVASPVPNSALPEGVATGTSSTGWTRPSVDKALVWFQRIELNTRTPQMVASSV